MKLTNSTPIPARADVSEVFGIPERVGFVVAKATYRFTARGQVTLDTEDPYPLFSHDEETPLGLLPRDDLARRDDAFEVITLGAAHAPGGQGLERTTVALTVANRRRELAISGDRTWTTELGIENVISTPEPFARMPLTYDRAFGGSTEVFIDRDAIVPVTHAFNALGRGFDPGPAAKALCTVINAPEGFPVYDRTRRLPNIEDPNALIARWDDSPRPAYWATVPMDSGLHASRTLELDQELEMPTVLGSPELLHRAHPDWIMSLPSPDSEIVLEGLSTHPRIAFKLPALRVLCDYVLGTRRGTRELAPHMLVLLPEEFRFYLVFRLPFTYAHEAGMERSMRLRLEKGWYQPEPEASGS